MEDKGAPAQRAGSAWPWLLTGTAIGAALGVLYAPQAGCESRKKIGQWLKRLKEKDEKVIFAGQRQAREPERELAGV